MNRDDFLNFSPRDSEPLVVAFVDFARTAGFSSSISWGFWDFTISDHSDEPQLGVKSVRNGISAAVLARLVVEPLPMKILLLEGENPRWDELEGQKLFLATTGTGLFVRNVGWRSLPGTPMVDAVSDLQLKIAPRWNQDADGTWLKACSRCGELKGTDGFYLAAYKTLKDPYRHICKSCFNPPKETL